MPTRTSAVVAALACLSFTETRFARSCQIAKQIKSLAKQYHQNQSIFKIKSQKRRPRKGRLGGDRAAFATPSRVPSIEKFGKAKKTVSYGKCSLVICLQVASNLLASRSPHYVRDDNPELVIAIRTSARFLSLAKKRSD